MRKLYYILFLFTLLCFGCQLKLTTEDENASASLLTIERFDRLEYRYLTTGDFSALQQMNTEYPIETRTLIEDVLKIGDATSQDINTRFLKFYQDTTLQAMVTAVEMEYAEMDDLNKQLNKAFERLKHFIPNITIPRVYSQISALDQSIVVGNGTIGISLDKYLGEDYPLYQKIYNAQQRKQMTRENIMPDCLSFYLIGEYPLENFGSRPQLERDLHIGKIQWVVNQALAKNVFQSKYVDAVERYMHKNSKTSYEELLKMRDFSMFNISE
ncbi:gliding motility protein GldB [Prevotella sp. HUN102]|uniref:gliding motility protein GldB-related protein n=1 Tax=Prevotella sp. HUN102 TaxID=1392486 RepID=UPI00048F34FE|nr:gliding motility protein GldB [Prevotella sp. HUN102]